MILINKNSGFITVAVLLFLTGTTIVVGNQVKAINQERRNFYGNNVSYVEEQKLLTKDVFYFDFDSYVVKKEDKLALFAHAKKLLRQPKLNILISGHTDNSGSLGYNFQLGLLRSTAIADVLASKGVNLNKMILISYANQIPAIITNNNFDAEQLNRRVELTYQYKAAITKK
jgi:outer membrane protein OmpA-like peptidoglycan-associated protein